VFFVVVLSLFKTREPNKRPVAEGLPP
jgi:hypothetical protein